MNKEVNISCLHQLTKCWHAIAVVKQRIDKIADLFYGSSGRANIVAVIDDKFIVNLFNQDSEDDDTVELEITIQEMNHFYKYFKTLRDMLKEQRRAADKRDKEEQRAREALHQAEVEEEERERLLDLLSKYGLPEEYNVKENS